MGWICLAYKYYWHRDHFLLVARSDHTTGSRNIKPEVVFKVQKMACYASFCLTMGPFKGKCLFFARLWPISVRVRVSFMTRAVRSAILATAGFLVKGIVVRSNFAIFFLQRSFSTYQVCSECSCCLYFMCWTSLLLVLSSRPNTQLHVLVCFHCAITQSYHLSLSRKVSHKILK